MGYVAARCPNCAGDLQLDDKMEKGYCTHCGTPIYFKDAVQRIKIIGPVQIAGLAKLDSLIKLIKKDLAYGMNQSDEFRNRLNRALELDPNNQYLYDLQTSEIWNAKIVDGKLVEYRGSVARIVVPDCVTTINRFAFKTCHKLKEIVLPRSITYIMEGAFFREDNLIISAYKNTYAARYALVSPAFLNIIDDDENNQEHIRKIEQILSEIVAIKNIVVKNINRHYNNKLYRRLFFPFSLVLILSIIFISNPAFLYTIFGKILALIGGIVAFFLITFSNGYLETCSKIAKRNQIMKFYKKSNDFLSPLGIIDFKYLKNIWECDNTDLEYEAKHLEKIKKQIQNMDKKQFLRNAHIDLSFLAYIAGERPKGLDDY